MPKSNQVSDLALPYLEIQKRKKKQTKKLEELFVSSRSRFRLLPKTEKFLSVDPHLSSRNSHGIWRE